MNIARSIARWVEQAESDRLAAEASVQARDISEDHTRYLYQQSYEKAIKAYAIGYYRLDEQRTDYPQRLREFQRSFLHKHSPISALRDSDAPLSRDLQLLRRQLLVFVRGLRSSDILLQIDRTSPSTNPHEMSYRYPFIEAGEYTAPCSRPASDWRIYQGDLNEVRSAIRELIERVKVNKIIMSRGH